MEDRLETFTACSGAVTEQYSNSWTVDVDGVTHTYKSQWRLGTSQGGPAEVDVLVMSFGGNDIGFADVLGDCVIVPTDWRDPPGCGVSVEELKGRIDALLNPTKNDCSGLRYRLESDDRYECSLEIGGRRGSIIDFYQDLVERRLTERGKLYVVGFPQLFAPVNEMELQSMPRDRAYHERRHGGSRRSRGALQQQTHRGGRRGQRTPRRRSRALPRSLRAVPRQQGRTVRREL